MNRTCAFSLLTFTLLLAACKSTGVIQMDKNSYFIGKKDGSPGVGISLSNKAEVYQEANAFCHEKKLEVKTLQVTVISASPGSLGSTELQFSCVPPSDTVEPHGK